MLPCVGAPKRKAPSLQKYMGNCLKPADPWSDRIPRDAGIDATAVRESGLPIIFLIGGPGSGKKTQAVEVAKRYGFLNLICGDIIRGEVSTRSQRGVILARMLSEGRLVPTDVLLELLKTKMLNSLETSRGYLLCGFPRDRDQGKLFDRQVRPPDLVLYLQARNSLLADRIEARSVALTERYQYGYEEIKQQIEEFRKKNKSIARHYKKKLVIINGEEEVPQVLENICRVMDDTLRKIQPPKAQTASQSANPGTSA